MSAEVPIGARIVPVVVLGAGVFINLLNEGMVSRLVISVFGGWLLFFGAALAYGIAMRMAYSLLNRPRKPDSPDFSTPTILGAVLFAGAVWSFDQVSTSVERNRIEDCLTELSSADIAEWPDPFFVYKMCKYGKTER